MQTFLPYADFAQSAKVLDKKRCWKQVIEAKQIIEILEGKSTKWKNHPAIKMWEGSLPELKFYFNAFLISATGNYKINTKLEPFLNLKEFYPRVTIYNSVKLKLPWWLGNEDFHRAMRARLIEKDREFYLPLFPKDEGFNDGKYFWPVMETKTFRII